MSSVKIDGVEFPEGPFTEAVTGFVLHKRSLGYKYDDGKLYALRGILRELNDMGGDGSVLTEDVVFSIQSARKGESRETQVTRTGLLRQLAIYMNTAGLDAYVLPPKLMKYDKTAFKAFIFTHDEVSSILRACDGHCARSKGMSVSAKMVYPAFVRTLYCCALRLSEARKLMTCDVNLDEARIFIRKSKHRKSRYVPLSDSLVAVLDAYAIAMEKEGISLDGGPFFPSPNGEIYSKSAIQQVIRACIAESVARKTVKGTTPRIHDIRHTAAVHMVEKLEAEGYDLRAMLPVLADVLGHAALWETEQYLQMPGYAYGAITELEGINSIIPEVDDED